MSEIVKTRITCLNTKWKIFALKQHVIRAEAEVIPVVQLSEINQFFASAKPRDEVDPITPSVADQIFAAFEPLFGKIEGHDDTGLSGSVDEVLFNFGLQLEYPWSDTYSIFAAESIVDMAYRAQECEDL